MTPQLGEPFILKRPLAGRDAYFPAVVEEARHGRVISARVPGPTVYRLGADDEAIRFQSRRLRATVQRLFEKFHPSDLWASRDEALMVIMEENVMTEFPPREAFP